MFCVRCRSTNWGRIATASKYMENVHKICITGRFRLLCISSDIFSLLPISKLGAEDPSNWLQPLHLTASRLSLQRDPLHIYPIQWSVTQGKGRYHLHSAKLLIDEECQKHTGHQDKLYSEAILLLVIRLFHILMEAHVVDDRERGCQEYYLHDRIVSAQAEQICFTGSDLLCLSMDRKLVTSSHWHNLYYHSR